MIRVYYIQSAGFEKKKESDKQIIHHKSTKHVPYISITGFTSLLSNKKHTQHTAGNSNHNKGPELLRISRHM